MPENSGMKNIKLTIIGWLALWAGPAFGQSNTQVQELALLSKTWGLLKYYHPNVATGKYDWDSILVAATNRLLQPGKATPVSSEIDLLLLLAGKDEAPERLLKTRHVLQKLRPVVDKNQQAVNRLTAGKTWFYCHAPLYGRQLLCPTRSQ
jgi:hypothetical protein